MVIYLPNDHVEPLVGLVRRLEKQGHLSDNEAAACTAVLQSIKYETGQKPYQFFLQAREQQRAAETRDKLQKRVKHGTKGKRKS